MLRNKLVVLGLLSENPKHGYQIIQDIKERSMDIWAKINVASVYNALISFEKGKFISVKIDRSGNMPEKKVYSITKTGIKELCGMVQRGLSRVEKGNNVVFLLAIGFMQNLSPVEACFSLKKRKQELEQILTMVEGIHKKHDGIIPFNWLYIIKDALWHIQLDLKKIKELIKKLEIMKNWNKGGKL